MHGEDVIFDQGFAQLIVRNRAFEGDAVLESQLRHQANQVAVDRPIANQRQGRAVERCDRAKKVLRVLFGELPPHREDLHRFVQGVVLFAAKMSGIEDVVGDVVAGDAKTVEKRHDRRVDRRDEIGAA